MKIEKIAMSVIVSLTLMSTNINSSNVEINQNITSLSQEIMQENSTIKNTITGDFNCNVGEIKTVKLYGVPDLFLTYNGNELAHPHPTTALLSDFVNYNSRVQAGFANYDNPNINRLFLENIYNFPTNITSGRFYINLKSNGSSLQYNDSLTIGDIVHSKRYSQRLTGLISDGWSHLSVNNNSNLLINTYWNNFSDIIFNNGTTLLEYVSNHNHFDVYVQDDTSVDFIAIATCSEPNPIEEIEKVVNNFECSENEELLHIIGGTKDAFATTTDNNAHPSNKLQNSTNSPIIGYDATQYDKHFLETLTLPNSIITKAELNIGYKPLGNYLHINDTMKVGDYKIQYSDGHLYSGSNWSNHILTQGWNINTISNGEKIAQANLANIHNSVGTGTIFDTMLSNKYLDIFIEDDTAVDFTQLNLCVANSCGQNVSIDLSQLENWTTRPSYAIENNVFDDTQYQGIWDDTLNWFQFPNNHTDEVLEIPFCACGDIEVNIGSLKADNNATIKLDNNLVVSQQGYDQDAMKRDDMGGNHVEGVETVAGTGIGVTHTLRLDVHNFGLYFGVAVDGKLNFQGYLGRCGKPKPMPVESHGLTYF